MLDTCTNLGITAKKKNFSGTYFKEIYRSNLLPFYTELLNYDFTLLVHHILTFHAKKVQKLCIVTILSEI